MTDERIVSGVRPRRVVVLIGGGCCRERNGTRAEPIRQYEYDFVGVDFEIVIVFWTTHMGGTRDRARRGERFVELF